MEYWSIYLIEIDFPFPHFKYVVNCVLYNTIFFVHQKCIKLSVYIINVEI